MHGRSEGKGVGRKRADEGGCNGARKRYRDERGRKGDREGGTLQRM